MHPSSPNARLASGRDRDHCRAAIKTGSRSFYAASLVLPAKVREPAYGLYAFCRLSDDAIDLGGGSLKALDRLRERLERAYCGRPMDHAADRAFADFLWRFSVPRARSGVADLPWDCRPAILAAANLYAEIGREIERAALDSITRRARVSGARKVRLLARAVAAAPWLSAVDPAPPLSAVDFLVEAVASAPAHPPRPRREPVGPQIMRVLEMFERLEKAEQFGK